MNRERERLLTALFEEEGAGLRRQATLLAAGRTMRHRRWKRRVARALLVVGLLALPTWWVLRPPPPTAANTASVTRPLGENPPIHRLTDQELLALFPDTPVGLVTLADGRKRLIFPRPEDRQRFMREL